MGQYCYLCIVRVGCPTSFSEFVGEMWFELVCLQITVHCLAQYVGLLVRDALG